MIKKAKRNFILIVSLILLIIFSALTLSFYFISLKNEQDDAAFLLNRIINAPRPVPGFPDNAIVESHAILVVYLKNSDATNMFYDINFYTEAEATSLVSEVLSFNQSEGAYQNMLYQVVENEFSIILGIVDRRVEMAVLYNSLLILIVIEIIAFLSLLGITYLFSDYVIKPLKVAISRQKEFITDASHELKTPLSIINASTDVLINQMGSNEWTNNIIDQVNYMSALINHLLELSILDENQIPIHLAHANLTLLVERELLFFDAVIFEHQKSLQLSLDEDCFIQTDPLLLKQLIRIFMDNAIKYSKNQSLIKVSLQKTKDHIVLKFYNEGCLIKDHQKDLVFERFAQGGSSSFKDQGYGLGLSIAKGIADQLEIGLSLDCRYGEYTEFILRFKPASHQES